MKTSFLAILFAMFLVTTAQAKELSYNFVKFNYFLSEAFEEDAAINEL